MDDTDKLPLHFQSTLLSQVIGSAMMSFGHLELEMRLVFGFLVTGGRVDLTDGLWEAVPNFRDKLDMLHATMKVAIKKPENAEFWRKLYNILSKKAKRRNAIAHGTSVNIVGKRMVLQPYFSEQNYLTIAQINVSAKSFIEVRDALRWFYTTQLTTAGPQIEPLLPVPHLARRLRCTIAQTHATPSRPPPPSPE